ncbi:MAG TPA: ThuA domain-containing protein [Verrucomicrobiota bacterium]|nr:ThuA domain-containing protein [Verrucomicrobiota bacterium]
MNTHVPDPVRPGRLNRRAFLLATTAMTALAPALAAESKRRVVVWAEGTAPEDKVYPQDVNTAIADGLKGLAGWEIVIAGLRDPDQGLSPERLAGTDVLMWWGHKLHGEVKDDLVQRIVRRVKEEGMGFIALHSAHFAKPYRALMGTRCSWREYKADGTSARVIVKLPDHPIARGVKDFELPKIERYGEPFAVPTPEAVVLDGVYTKPNGEKEPGRMGLCWTVGKGRVFYFTPGHETYDDFFRADVRQVLRNAVEWACAAGNSLP